MTMFRLAYFSPLPPVRSGIADHSAELLPHLAQRAEISLFTNDPEQVDRELRTRYDTLPTSDFAGMHWLFDTSIYHIGNSEFHESIYQTSLKFPGLVVLHEVGLHEFVAHRASLQGNPSVYTRELGYTLGPLGFHHAQEAGSRKVWAIPLSKRLIETSLGIIVHSHFAYQLVEAQRAQVPVQVIPQLMTPVNGEARRRSDIGWTDDTLVFASLGQIISDKNIEMALRSFQRVLASIPTARFLIIGEEFPGTELHALIDGLGLDKRVHLTGFVERLSELIDWLLMADVVMNLRYPTLGETSASALRSMAAAKPLIVFDHGWYSEIPDAAAFKIPVLNEDRLYEAMLEVGTSAKLRGQMGKAALEHIRQQCAPERVTKAYMDFIGKCLRLEGTDSA